MGKKTSRSHLATSFCLGSLVRHCLHELVDQLVVLLASDSFVLESDIQGVIQQCLDQKCNQLVTTN